MDDVPIYAFQPNLGGLLSLLLTIALPLIAGLLSKRSWSSNAKFLMLLAVATVKTFLEGWISALNDSVPFAFIPVVMNLVINFVVAVAIHFGAWKPSGASDTVLDTGPVKG